VLTNAAEASMRVDFIIAEADRAKSTSGGLNIIG
jgi:hypothetical protein